MVNSELLHTVDIPDAPIITDTQFGDENITTELPESITTVLPEGELKVMPQASPSEGPKEMPVSVPPQAESSDTIATANNEILPPEGNRELLFLQPPSADFEAHQTEQPPSPSAVRLLSRQETFSWALKDVKST